MTHATALTTGPQSDGTFASRANAHRLSVGASDEKIGVHALDVSAIGPDGIPQYSRVRVPALPLFDSAFAAFAHGTLMQGETSTVAIEDLMPGDKLQTASGACAIVRWIASSSFSAKSAERTKPLIRAMPDSFGVGRPGVFTTFGPAARLFQTPHHLRASHTGAPLLTSMSEFIDGVNVIEIAPPAPVRLYHICLDRHAIINAGGLEMESFHPEMKSARSLPQQIQSLFLSLFPGINDFADFGPLRYTRAPSVPSDLNAA